MRVAVPLSDGNGLPAGEVGGVEERGGAAAVFVAAHARDTRVAALLFRGAEVDVADGEKASGRRARGVDVVVVEIFLGRQQRICAEAMGLVVIVRAGQKGLGLDAPFVIVLLHFLEAEELQLFVALPVLPASCPAEFSVLGLKALWYRAWMVFAESIRCNTSAVSAAWKQERS